MHEVLSSHHHIIETKSHPNSVALLLHEKKKNTNTKITKLAQGLPVGGEIEKLDDGTLFSAFKNRNGLKS